MKTRLILPEPLIVPAESVGPDDQIDSGNAFYILNPKDVVSSSLDADTDQDADDNFDTDGCRYITKMKMEQGPFMLDFFLSELDAGNAIYQDKNGCIRICPVTQEEECLRFVRKKS